MNEPTGSFPTDSLPIAYHPGIFNPSYNTYHNGGHCEIENRSDLSSSTSSNGTAHSIEYQIENIENGSIKAENRRSIWLLFGVVGVCLFSAAVIAGVIYLCEEPNNIENVQTFEGFVRVNETFESSMSEAGSEEFQSFEEIFCSNIELFVQQNVHEARCKINSLSNGSILVNFTLEVSTNTSVDDTQDLLTDLFNATHVGGIPIYPGARFSPGTQALKEFSITSWKSSCLSEDLPIMARNHTYPNHCDEYKVCVQGKPVFKKCPKGLEFSFLSADDVTVCAQPSNTTYCGKERAKIVPSEASQTLTPLVETTSSPTEDHFSPTLVHATSNFMSTIEELPVSTAVLAMTSRQTGGLPGTISISGTHLSTYQGETTWSTLSSAMSAQEEASSRTTPVHATSAKYLWTSNGYTTLSTPSAPVATLPVTSFGITPVHGNSENHMLDSKLDMTSLTASSTMSSDNPTVHAYSEIHLETSDGHTTSSGLFSAMSSIDTPFYSTSKIRLLTSYEDIALSTPFTKLSTQPMTAPDKNTVDCTSEFWTSDGATTVSTPFSITATKTVTSSDTTTVQVTFEDYLLTSGGHTTSSALFSAVSTQTVTSSDTTTASATSRKDTLICNEDTTISFSTSTRAVTQTSDTRPIHATSKEYLLTSDEDTISFTISSAMSTHAVTYSDTTTVYPTSEKYSLFSFGVTKSSTLFSEMTTQAVTSSITTAIYDTSEKNMLSSNREISSTISSSMSTQAVLSADTSTVYAASETHTWTYDRDTTSSTMSTTVSSHDTTSSDTTTDWPAPFTCPKSGAPFIPANDTYPNHCTKFQRCDNGVAFSFNCANGTHFVYSSSVQYVCNWPYDPLTFCNRMKASRAQLP